MDIRMSPKSAMVLLLAIPAALSLGAPAALAQAFGGGGAGSNGFSPPVPSRPLPPRAPPAPPALPGATSQQPAAPAQHLPTDLPPTEALFDAIDRGDMPAAKDALARGADLNADNVLGMTALEMSVDLGRNDITFLLLSLRGASPAARAASVGVASGQDAGGPGTPGGKRGSSARIAASIAAARPSAASAGSEQARPRVHYAQSTSSGSDPQAGFLGFGAIAQP